MIKPIDIKNWIDGLFSINIADRERTFVYTYYRGVYYELCKKYLPSNALRVIGEVVNREHSSVLVARRKFYDLINSPVKAEETYRQEYLKMEEMFLQKFGHLIFGGDDYIEGVDKQIREENKILKSELERVDKEHEKVVYDLLVDNKKLLQKYNDLKSKYNMQLSKVRQNTKNKEREILKGIKNRQK